MELRDNSCIEVSVGSAHAKFQGTLAITLTICAAVLLCGMYIYLK